jgi:hypothetical protein
VTEGLGKKDEEDECGYATVNLGSPGPNCGGHLFRFTDQMIAIRTPRDGQRYSPEHRTPIPANLIPTHNVRGFGACWHRQAGWNGHRTPRCRRATDCGHFGCEVLSDTCHLGVLRAGHDQYHRRPSAPRIGPLVLCHRWYQDRVWTHRCRSASRREAVETHRRIEWSKDQRGNG